MTKEEAIEILYEMEAKTAYSGELGGLAVEMAVDALVNQPSLPFNLDEAAEKYAYTNWQSDDYHEGASEGLPFDAIGHTEKCFKAGAQWMTAQGISVKGSTDIGLSDEYYIKLQDYLESLPNGTEIIFQVRKK